ncbi:uncharacterized protein LOC103317583 isoform X2 [Nasonia vitripennis]|uniref:DUF4806 domain-containing protein n=1 Tax=Nasonia vitripennis TaxID=7425 RepID=A0A7M7R513_NASVI|nr:uncharacterized protein LOC103317583 isoform X2 [Nasonia vitripennis]XP_032457671.1 uncharacterized protein LOC103317583 isoform X2 [Nasonia vitripennis]XP_032457672.1 uncharacterized protein LOC103317583 isoform X2 [Nasonia vitripennis]
MKIPPPLPPHFFAQSFSPSNNSTGSQIEENVDTELDDTETIIQEGANVDENGVDILQHALNQSFLYAGQYAAPEETGNEEDLAIDPQLLHRTENNESENDNEGNHAAGVRMQDREINENYDNNRNAAQVAVNQNQTNMYAPVNQNRRNSIAYLQEENHHPDKYCIGCKNTCIHILKSLIELKEAIQNNPNMAIIPAPTFDLLPRLPFENVENLDDFDERLGDPREADMADQFEKLLASKGGNTLSKIVSKAMSAFITDELCKKIIWTGVKYTLKAEIMNFPSIVIKVVRKQFACKDSEAEEQIKDWLRRPSDRIAQAAKTQRNKMMRQERRLQRRGNRQNEN